MLLPGQFAIRRLTTQQCLASCRSLNLRRVAIRSTSIARQYATDEQKTVQRPVSRPKAHTGRTTATRKPRSAPRATEAGPNAGLASSSQTRNANRSKAKPKAKSKAKPKAKKKAQPKKKTRKPLTDEQKAAAADKKKRDDLKTLKAKALKPPAKLPATVFQVLVSESSQSLKGRGVAGRLRIGDITGSASAKYKALSTERREHYNQIANENQAKNARQYRQWIESHAPAVIREANQARVTLNKGLSPKRYLFKLHDDREVKGFQTAYVYFYGDRFRSGDFSGVRVSDAAKRIAVEWRALSADEKKPYVDRQNNDMARYDQEMKSVYNHDVRHEKPRARQPM